MRIGIISGVIGVFITLSGFFVKFGGTSSIVNK